MWGVSAKQSQSQSYVFDWVRINIHTSYKSADLPSNIGTTITKSKAQPRALNAYSTTCYCTCITWHLQNCLKLFDSPRIWWSLSMQSLTSVWCWCKESHLFLLHESRQSWRLVISKALPAFHHFDLLLYRDWPMSHLNNLQSMLCDLKD